MASADSRTPAWFIADSSLASVGEKREQAARADAQATLQQIFPSAPAAQLRAAVNAGGDLATIVDRLLAQQEPEAPPDAPAGAAPAGPRPRRVRFAEAGPSSAGAFSAEPPTQVEQMVFDGGRSHFGGGPSVAADGAPLAAAGGGGMSRLSDEELSEQMSSSGINADPTAGSARGLGRDGGREGGDATLGGVLQSGLGDQTLAQLAAGALRLHARVVRTVNELEEGMLGEKVVTKFIVEVQQLSFKWEVPRRYSEFYQFHELLSLQWSELPELPPKMLFSQECGDIAERMLQLDKYLLALLAAPALALSPLVCTFLDAIDVQSFRLQLLPRLRQMDTDGNGPPPVAQMDVDGAHIEAEP